MRETSLFLTTLFILLVSFLSYNPSITGLAVQEEVLSDIAYDINVDGEVNLKDLEIVQEALAGWEHHQVIYPDVNGDGEVTNEDEELLKTYLDTLSQT